MVIFGSLGLLNKVKEESPHMQSFVTFLLEQDQTNLSSDPSIAKIQRKARERQPFFPEGPTPYPQRKLDGDLIRKEIQGDEGFRGDLYKDHRGNPTIFYGHLKKPESQDIFTQSGISPDRAKDLLSGRATGTREEGQAVFDQDIGTYVDRTKKYHYTDPKGRFKQGDPRIPDLEYYNPEFQAAAVSRTFRGKEGPKTDAHIRDRDFEAAAKEHLDDDEYRREKRAGSGVAPRMERGSEAIRSATFDSRAKAYEYTDEQGRTQTRDPFKLFPKPTTPATRTTTQEPERKRNRLTTAGNLGFIPNK